MIMSDTALLLVDLQNDFLHPEGAYGRAGVRASEFHELPGKLAALARIMRDAGGWIVSTHFTLVPGKFGEPFISEHLKRLRPFLGKGDFAPGSFGHALVGALAPSDIEVEKVAYSAFYSSRLDWVLRQAGVRKLIVGGIVTNGGVASTVRDASVRSYDVTVLRDGCAAFDRRTHEVNIEALRSVAHIMTCEDFVNGVGDSA